MFGYVKVYQPELKMREFEQYRGVYCSLCRTLGKQYGCTAQMSLSYDVTFLVLLRMAVFPECVGFRKGHCVYNPCKRRLRCGEHSALTYGADVSVLLTWHRLQDAVCDSGFAKRTAASTARVFSARHYRRAAKRLPETDCFLSECMKRQNELERAQTPSLDAAAEPTANMLAHLCSAGVADEKQRRILERLGYCLGSWVYRMDAVDDLVDDLKNNAYNPLLLSHSLSKGDTAALQAVREEMLLSLNALLAECKAAYELLSVHHFDGILRNILEWGLPHMQTQTVFGEQPKSNHAGGQNHEKSV